MSAGQDIVVLDYGVGNVASVRNAIDRVGGRAIVTRDKSAISNCSGLIVPGVGAFAHVMESLADHDCVSLVTEFVASGRPMLGICVGMQFLFEYSTEFGKHTGLGILPGYVDRIPVPPGARLPHIEWDIVVETAQSSGDMYANISCAERRFYFLHSFAATEVPPSIVTAEAHYEDVRIVASVQKDNLWATQFHPERSGESGLKLLSNFLKACGLAPSSRAHRSR